MSLCVVNYIEDVCDTADLLHSDLKSFKDQNANGK